MKSFMNGDSRFQHALIIGAGAALGMLIACFIINWVIANFIPSHRPISYYMVAVVFFCGSIGGYYLKK